MIMFNQIQKKNNYILQNNLGGAMFWELSGDRNAELVGNTYAALNGGKTPTPGTTTATPTGTTTTGITTATTTGTTAATTTTTSSGDIPDWATDISYSVGQKVKYQGHTYKCIQAHTSEPTWTPTDAPSLWERLDF